MLASTICSGNLPQDTLARSDMEARGAEVALDELLSAIGRRGKRAHSRSWGSARDAAAFDAWAALLQRVHRRRANRRVADAFMALALRPPGFVDSSRVSPGSASDFSLGFATCPAEYRDRVGELQASAEEEGIRPDPRSLEHFVQFVQRAGFPLRAGSLFLSDEGTYAAVWRNDQWRLNLNFLADGSMEYVLLNRESEQLEGETGRVDPEGFADLRARLGLDSLLRA